MVLSSLSSTTLNSQVWGLGGFFWTQVMNTVEAVKSANSCMEMQPDSPNCQWVWESPSVHAFGLWCGWEQSRPVLHVSHFFFSPQSSFRSTKSIWSRLIGGLWLNCVCCCKILLQWPHFFCNIYKLNIVHHSYFCLADLPQSRRGFILQEMQG